jgi:hypothetical protein
MMNPKATGNITNAINNKTGHKLSAIQVNEDHYIFGICICIVAAMS